MWNRVFACAVLIGASTALAAPPTDAPVVAAAPQDIDVDALARAKDVDAKAADATLTPEPAEAAAEAASATEPVAATPATETADSAVGEVPATQADAPVAEAKPAEPSADAVGADTAATGKADSEASPAAIAGSEEQRLAASCVARATRLLDDAQKGDYAAATRDFDAKMASALPPAKFGEAWNQLAQFGKLKARGQSHTLKGDGYIAVTIPLIFDKKSLYAQIACGSDGRIAGFYVKPLEIPGQ